MEVQCAEGCCFRVHAHQRGEGGVVSRAGFAKREK
jgi:hypothetical protein